MLQTTGAEGRYGFIVGFNKAPADTAPGQEPDRTNPWFSVARMGGAPEPLHFAGRSTITVLGAPVAVGESWRSVFTLSGANPLSLGVTAGDAVSYRALDGDVVKGTVELVGPSTIEILFPRVSAEDRPSLPGVRGISM